MSVAKHSMTLVLITYLDAGGVLRAECASCPVLGWYLQDDARGRSTCQRVLRTLEKDPDGFERSGNAHTISVRGSRVEIVNAYVEGSERQVSLVEFRAALAAWLRAMEGHLGATTL